METSEVKNLAEKRIYPSVCGFRTIYKGKDFKENFGSKEVVIEAEIRYIEENLEKFKHYFAKSEKIIPFPV